MAVIFVYHLHLLDRLGKSLNDLERGLCPRDLSRLEMAITMPSGETNDVNVSHVRFGICRLPSPYDMLGKMALHRLGLEWARHLVV